MIAKLALNNVKQLTIRKSDTIEHNNPRMSVRRRLISNATESKPKDDRITHFAKLVEPTIPAKPSLRDILDGVWKNETITSQCPNLVIRLTSLRGQVSKKLWAMKGNNPDDIQILAVGTVEIPQHLTSYHKFLDNFYQRSAKYSLGARMKDHKYEVGYDLLSKGSDDSRRAVLTYFNEHYGFSSKILDQISTNSAITAGGMRGLKDIADGLVITAKEKGHVHRFVQPDNSFGTWWNIIERPDDKDKNRREIYTVGTRPENKIHLTSDDVNRYYSSNPLPNKESEYESWYITPVGNPSGTAMTRSQLKDTVDAILRNNPKSIIILDSVYARTMKKEDAKEILSGVTENDRYLNNIIFLESFSKSHGLCRERLGIYFSCNENLLTKVHSANIAFSAGPGVHKDFQFLALGNPTNEDKIGVSDLHMFWQQERKGLIKFLSQNKFSHLFEKEQQHIRKEDIDRPCTLYVLLKTKNGMKAFDVFMETGVLGVDTPLSSGHYIRFSLGTLSGPTFSKYQ